MDILDPATLQRLQSLEFRPGEDAHPRASAFSLDTRMLTSIFGYDRRDTRAFVVSWDLQTGGVVSAIEREGPKIRWASITYSMNVKMVAVFSKHTTSATISIYNVVTGAYVHDVDPLGSSNPDPVLRASYVYQIWAYGESIRFATPEPTGITIWEVGFAPGATPTQIETISIPCTTTFFPNIRSQDIRVAEFHPASHRLAFYGPKETLLVWDVRTSKSLLHLSDIDYHNFSPDGRFLACTVGPKACLWKESPTGYTLFGTFTPATYPIPHFSPDGQSIVTFLSYQIQLWDTKSIATATSGILVQALQRTNRGFLLEFLPDRPLAVTTRKEDKTVTVFDLESGVPRLTIDTSIEVYGLRSIGNTIIVIGDEKVITWNLPEGNFFPCAGMNVKDSTRTINFRNKDIMDFSAAASVSLDLRYIAIVGGDENGNFLDVYCVSTGQNIRRETWATALWFAPGEREIWCVDEDEDEAEDVFTISRGALHRAEAVADIGDGRWGCPWGSSCGYEVRDDGWIIGAGGDRLLMLPPLWQPGRKVNRVWNGKYLALLSSELPEPVILELEP